jgi:hypothetical protein
MIRPASGNEAMTIDEPDELIGAPHRFTPTKRIAL